MQSEGNFYYQLYLKNESKYNRFLTLFTNYVAFFEIFNVLIIIAASKLGIYDSISTCVNISLIFGFIYLYVGLISLVLFTRFCNSYDHRLLIMKLEFLIIAPAGFIDSVNYFIIANNLEKINDPGTIVSVMMVVTFFVGVVKFTLTVAGAGSALVYLEEMNFIVKNKRSAVQILILHDMLAEHARREISELDAVFE